MRAALLSALRSVEVLREANSDIDAQVQLYLDNPDKKTIAIASGFSDQVGITQVSFGDLGLVRNYAIDVGTDSTHFAFLDGDDLWSSNWLALAANKAIEFSDSNFVLHPEIAYCFGTQGIESRVISEHISTSDSRYDPYALIAGNYWSALSFASRELYQQFPYVRRSLDLSIGFEDWIFNIQTVGAGTHHVAVPRTAHFHRRKSNGSLAQAEIDREATFIPTRFWWDLIRA